MNASLRLITKPIVALALALHGVYLPKYKMINPYHIIAGYMTLYLIDASGRK